MKHTDPEGNSITRKPGKAPSGTVAFWVANDEIIENVAAHVRVGVQNSQFFGVIKERTMEVSLCRVKTETLVDLLLSLSSCSYVHVQVHRSIAGWCVLDGSREFDDWLNRIDFVIWHEILDNQEYLLTRILTWTIIDAILELELELIFLKIKGPE